MKMSDYLKSIGISGALFARQIGVNPPIIYAAVNGYPTLNVFNALLIEAATNGDVKAIDLCTPQERKKIKAVTSPFKKIGKKVLDEEDF